MKIFKIFKRQLALKLIELNNNMIYTEQNYKNNKFVVFCFEDTLKLRNDLGYINKK